MQRRDASRRWEQILQELRVTQTGTQIISGFLLSVAFQPTFAKLPGHARVVYLALVVLACAATLLGLLPVVQHRKRPGRDADRRLVATGSRILIALLVLVTLLAVGVAVFVFDVVLGAGAAFVAGGVALAAAVVIWALPAHRRAGSDRHERTGTDVVLGAVVKALAVTVVITDSGPRQTSAEERPMSEIDDEGLLPPNVHHARPEKPEQSDEDADRERAAEGAEEDGTRREEDPNEDAMRHPHAASTRRRGPEESDDPYAKPGEDPYGKDAAVTTDRPEPGDDQGRVDGETDGAGDDGAPRGHGTGEAGTGEPPD